MAKLVPPHGGGELKPLLLEGPAGVGKTELSKAVSGALAMPLIRLQCYEGLDETKALYEWEYAKQLLYTQILKDKIGELLEGAVGLRELLRLRCALPERYRRATGHGGVARGVAALCAAHPGPAPLYVEWNDGNGSTARLRSRQVRVQLVQ